MSMEDSAVSTKGRPMVNRPGCYYCFSTVDSRASNGPPRQVVICRHCDALYHQDCWENTKSCIRCGQAGTSVIQVTPTPLCIRSRSRSIPITPTAVYYDLGGPTIRWPHSLSGFLEEYYAIASRTAGKGLSLIAGNAQGNFSRFVRANDQSIARIIALVFPAICLVSALMIPLICLIASLIAF